MHRKLEISRWSRIYLFNGVVCDVEPVVDVELDEYRLVIHNHEVPANREQLYPEVLVHLHIYLSINSRVDAQQTFIAKAMAFSKAFST